MPRRDKKSRGELLGFYENASYCQKQSDAVSETDYFLTALKKLISPLVEES